ncbi:hypothetical protein CEXT_518571 [Caerostris extrusa]|uniref:Uncharacterized protein n=1 Tax=Caerostris extrusa TaxID=172846 RepID=A0AAV4TXR0_CAEEX|nr:hypothetical protein CEXT_518571 [Caerostris extrusa]
MKSQSEKPGDLRGLSCPLCLLNRQSAKSVAVIHTPVVTVFLLPTHRALPSRPPPPERSLRPPLFHSVLRDSPSTKEKRCERAPLHEIGFKSQLTFTFWLQTCFKNSAQKKP